MCGAMRFRALRFGEWNKISVFPVFLSTQFQTDTSGYPEYHKILEALLKNAEGRELRDFLQDSTDECFKFMKQGSSEKKTVFL